jgi:hypothetical protein
MIIVKAEKLDCNLLACARGAGCGAWTVVFVSPFISPSGALVKDRGDKLQGENKAFDGLLQLRAGDPCGD